MPAIRSFRDLIVYRRSIHAAKLIFLRTKVFPREEVFALTNQVRRSSRAVGAMVAEAWARRRYPASFVNKVNEALGECLETQAWLDHSLACSYITQDEHITFDDEWQQIGAMLNGMIDRAENFCRSASR